MIVHCQRLNGTCAQPPALHAQTAPSRPVGRHVVQMACGRPMCLQHDSCSWSAMFGMALTASSHCPAAWQHRMCSPPRAHAPRPLQIEAGDTCVAAPRYAPCMPSRLTAMHDMYQ